MKTYLIKPDEAEQGWPWGFLAAFHWTHLQLSHPVTLRGPHLPSLWTALRCRHTDLSPDASPQETLEDLDKNKDGYVQVEEYIGE